MHKLCLLTFWVITNSRVNTRLMRLMGQRNESSECPSPWPWSLGWPRFCWRAQHGWSCSSDFAAVPHTEPNEFLLLAFCFKCCIILLNPTPCKGFFDSLYLCFFPLFVSGSGAQNLTQNLAPLTSSPRHLVPSWMSPQGHQRNWPKSFRVTVRILYAEVHWD